MDTSDPQISFTDTGTCNHCVEFEKTSEQLARRREAEPWESVVDAIKRRGEGRPYDCLIGLSGGVDSSYVALLAHRAGLRTLAVHLDNGWNSELAVGNIERLLDALDMDLITHVVDWHEFREIQKAYFRAGVVDIEMPTDHAITALTTRVAIEHKVPTVLRGVNHATEAVMPAGWRHTKTDRRNLRAIVRRFGGTKIKTLPTTSTIQVLVRVGLRRIRYVDVLDHIEFVKATAVEELRSEIGWRAYAGKHHESRFTAFYQEVVLPQKFGIDKRRAHYSALINSGQMTREQALSALNEPFLDPHAQRMQWEFVLKKLGVDESEFESWMSEPPHSHLEYPSEATYVQPLVRMAHAIRSQRAPRSLARTD